MTSNVSWLEEKFVDCSVALALTIVNETNEFTLEHRQTYFHDGCGDPFYDIPPTILPKVFFLNLLVFLFVYLSSTVPTSSPLNIARPIFTMVVEICSML
jgi:hypothetical protein